MNKYKFQRYEEKLESIAEETFSQAEYETTAEAISAAAFFLYNYNQFYYSTHLEDLVLGLSKKLIRFKSWESQKNKKILFYDGFGLDRRGIAIVTCKAICLAGYNLIYVSPLKNKNNQPTLSHELSRFNIDWRYIDTDSSYLNEIKQICTVFEETQPEFAFLYTYPNDVSGTVVFDALKDKCIRCQLDLTDHAFWLGLNAFDICNGGRQFSASIQHFYRGIPFEKMTQLDANLFVDDCPFQGLPFDENERFIFSGGSLYKTLGDENNTYYKIVDHILENHSDVKFLYAGTGDDTQMKNLIKKYSARVFLISERPDFYQIMKRCTLYLNTYPMFGGLMMRYAALAGKIPITLKHGQDSDGILIRQSERQIEYESYEDLISDVDRLLSDSDYLTERTKILEGAVVTEQCFVRNIKMLIEDQKTGFPYSEIKPVDTTQFRKECLERFTFENVVNSIAQQRHKFLIKYFPDIFIFALFYKLKAKLRRIK